MESLGSKLAKVLISKMPFKEHMSMSGEEFWEVAEDNIFRDPVSVKPNIFRDLKMDTIDANGEKYYRIYPEKDDAEKVIIYFHGGTFIYGIFPFHFNMLYDILEGGKIEALVPLYPLLPEADAEMIHESILDTYRAVLNAEVEPEKIILMGDSAGGYLCLLLMHLLRREGLPFPGQMVLISPLLDFCEPPKYAKALEEKDPFIAMGCRDDLLKVLGEGREVTDPLVSPRFGDMRDFPKTDVISGTDDLLHIQASNFYRDKHDEFDLRLHLFDDMMHNFPIMPIKEGLEARKLIKKIIE